MELPSVTVAEANTLICCPESNDINCMICPSGLKLQDWKKHIFHHRHLRAVEQFNLIFEILNGKIHCVPCDANLDWHDLQNHAKNHMVLPWHKLAKEHDKYEIFFDNRIIEWKNIFQCRLCDATFSEWINVFIHTTDVNHQKFCAEESKWIYEFPSEVSYEFLVTEGIIAHNEIFLECQICRVKVAVSNVERHAKGLMHRGNKSKFRLQLEESKISKISNKFIRRMSVESVETIVNDFFTNQREIETDFSTNNQPSETDFSKNEQEIKTDFSSNNESIETDSSKNNRTIQADNSTIKRSNESEISTNKQIIERENLSYLYIEKRDEIESFCVICNCVMFHHSVKNHIKDKEHIDAEIEYGCSKISWINDNQYCCKICDRQLCAPANVRTHVTGSKHLKTLHKWMERKLQMNSKNDEISKQSEIERKQNSVINNDIMCINGYYYCKRCTIYLSGLETLYEHITGRKHLYKSSKKSIQTFPDRIDGFERNDEVTDVTDRSTDHCSIKQNDNDDLNYVSEEASKKYLEKIGPLDENENSAGEPQLPVGKNVELQQIPKVDLQTREENHSYNLEKSKTEKFKWQMNNYETLRRPKINPMEKDKMFLDTLNKSNEQVIQQNPQNSLKILVNDDFFNDYLVKENETDYRCEICDCVIYGSQENKYIHSTGSFHMESLKKYGCDYILVKSSNIYYCECCDLAITNRHDLYLHIKQKSHANFVAKSQTNDLNTKSLVEKENCRENENSQNIDKNLPASPMVYILRESDEVSKCHICDIELYTYEEIHQHILCTDHVDAMTKYGCDRILHPGGDCYYCVCCKCKITGPPCVCTHVKGRRHYFGLRNLLDTEEVKRVKRNINAMKSSEGQESNANLGLIADELSKLLVQNKLRETKNRRRRTNVE